MDAPSTSHVEGAANVVNAVRQPILAGAWYPGDPERLRARVAEYLDGADPRKLPPGVPAVALAPHAGYDFSGPTAGKLFGLLRGRRFDAVFILAPSHRARLDRPALPAAGAFATPLGEVPVATGIVRRLAETGHFVVDDQAHAFEHAVEIQLPFIQCALAPDTPVVPVLVPPLAAAARHAAARALDPWRDDRHLLLVSTDLTHYGRDYGYVPFTDDVPARLEQLDTGAMLRFLGRDAEGLLRYREETGITMCGLDAAALALDGETGEHHAELIDYARSADRNRDYSMCVSYAAAVITRPETAAALTLDERTFLVALARRAVAAAAADEPAPDPAAVADDLGQELTASLRQPRGAFVTLTADGRLRGCIGVIESDDPLVESVARSAANAAVSDPRFPPVRPEEVPGLRVEVSALTPLRAVDGPEAIEIGRHGILLSRGPHRAVFLPQVAPEQGWDLTTTLSQLARKAGLAPDAWRTGCRFEVFEAEICKE